VEAVVGEDARLVLDSLPWVSAHGSRVERSLAVDLGAGATLLARETIVLGRSGEGPGTLVSASTITREGRPVLVEELRSEHLAPYRVLDSVLSIGRGVGPGSPAPLVLDTGDRIWRRLGREAHETAAVLDPVWAAVSGRE
jgi:urease accessory protein